MTDQIQSQPRHSAAARWENEGGRVKPDLAPDEIEAPTIKRARRDGRRSLLETEGQRRSRLEREAVERRERVAFEEQTIDEAIRESIRRHGA